MPSRKSAVIGFCVLLSVAMLAMWLSKTAAAQDKPASIDSSEQALVRVPIEHYFRGHATGQASHIRKAFLPTAHIEGVRDGKFSTWTLEEYAANFKSIPPANENERTRKIDVIDVSGTAAMARATLVFGPTNTVTDYFVLLKVDGEWKIANKVYSAQRR